MKPAVFKDVAGMIPQGAVLLWRPTSWAGRLIARLDRSPYSHVGMFYKGSGTVWSLEFLQWCGGVQEPLENYVAKYPGKIDVYDLPAAINSYHRNLICEEMQRLIVAYPRYGWRQLWRGSRWYLPGIRLIGRLNTRDDQLNGGAPHCSMARAKADWAVGYDFVHNMPAHMTTPGDYGRCSELRKLYTLFYTEDQIRELEN